jgi:hypothetical protein
MIVTVAGIVNYVSSLHARRTTSAGPQAAGIATAPCPVGVP